jgi:Rieske Fe-S protein
MREDSQLLGLTRNQRLLALALLMATGIAAIVIVTAFLAFLWVEEDESVPSGIVEAGRVTNLELRYPVFFEKGHFWLVRLDGDEVIAIYARDPNRGCTVPWRPDFSFRGPDGRDVKGWFRNPCHGQTYDIQGRCVFGPCIRGLDRFDVKVSDGEIFVDTGQLLSGPAVEAQ